MKYAHCFENPFFCCRKDLLQSPNRTVLFSICRVLKGWNQNFILGYAKSSSDTINHSTRRRCKAKIFQNMFPLAIVLELVEKKGTITMRIEV